MSNLLARVLARVLNPIRSVRQAWRAALARHPAAMRFVLVGLWLTTTPAIAHAGIWNGGLCNIYQQVLDNELLEIVSLASLVGTIVVWLLDDGKSNIKTNILRGAVGTLAIINMPLLWASVFNHGVACTGSI